MCCLGLMGLRVVVLLLLVVEGKGHQLSSHSSWKLDDRGHTVVHIWKAVRVRLEHLIWID
jgi:hypothetical protein